MTMYSPLMGYPPLMGYNYMTPQMRGYSMHGYSLGNPPAVDKSPGVLAEFTPALQEKSLKLKPAIGAIQIGLSDMVLVPALLSDQYSLTQEDTANLAAGQQSLVLMLENLPAGGPLTYSDVDNIWSDAENILSIYNLSWMDGKVISAVDAQINTYSGGTYPTLESVYDGLIAMYEAFFDAYYEDEDASKPAGTVVAKTTPSGTVKNTVTKPRATKQPPPANPAKNPLAARNPTGGAKKPKRASKWMIIGVIGFAAAIVGGFVYVSTRPKRNSRDYEW
jgi:hypothetical protein